VRTAIIMLLCEGPLNGYALMSTIEERSGGRWRPSPGSVYPTLSQLEDEGLIAAEEQQDGRRRYGLTEAGRSLAQACGRAPWEEEGQVTPGGGGNLRELVHGLRLAAAQVARAGGERQVEQAADVLARARRDIYRILAEEPGPGGPGGG